MAENPTDERAVVPAPVRFTNAIMAAFEAEVGAPIELTPQQKEIARHLYVYLNNQIRQLESQRKNQNRPRIDWRTVDLDALAVDAVKVVQAGLDPYIKNFVHALPYFNDATQKYKLSLTPGYAGMEYHIRRTSLHPIVDIVWRLVYEGDKFIPLYKGEGRAFDSYIYEPAEDVFNPGPVKGGFGYVIYEDERLNKLHVIYMRDFERARNAASTKDIWNAYPEDMMRKTIMRRLYDRIPKKPECADEVRAIQTLGPSVSDVLTESQQAAREALEAADDFDITPEELGEPEAANEADGDKE